MALSIRYPRAAERAVRAAAAAAIACCAAASVAATPVSGDLAPVPTLEGHIADMAGVLSSDERISMERMLSDFEAQTGHQLAVLIVSELQGERIEDLSLRAAQIWHQDSPGWDNGILVTLSIGDRQVRIDIGKSMEKYINDSVATMIINEQMVPAFRHGAYAAGLHAGILRLMAEARHPHPR